MAPAVFSVPGGVDEGVFEVDYEGMRAGEVLGDVGHGPGGEKRGGVRFNET